MPERATMADHDDVTAGPPDTVGYVLKGYPRISELFIASEIWRLERMGVPIRLFVLKPADETVHHPIVDEIRATPRHLPPTTSLSASGLPRWLRTNLPQFGRPIARAARRHPIGLTRATARAAAQSWRARSGWRPKSLYVKELLLAVALADELDTAGDVRHLHAHFAHGCTTVTWLASAITGTPFSFTGHAKDIYRDSLNPAGLLRRKLAAAEFALTCTGANHAHLTDLAPEADVELAYHGLNAEFARQLEAAPPPAAPSDRLRVVSVGRLVPKKGFDVLIRAVAELTGRDVPVDLVIAGEDGPERSRLEALARDLRVDVEWRGTVSQAELLTEYRQSSAFALACRVDDTGDRDGIPNVLVEAMASGLPVVSTAVSGIPELVDDGRNGLLVAPEDVAGLADALLRLAKDPDVARELATAGRRTVSERFDGERLARRLADRFAQLDRANGTATGRHRRSPR